MKQICWLLLKIPLFFLLAPIFIFLFIIITISGAILTLFGFDVVNNQKENTINVFANWFDKEFLDNDILSIILAILILGSAILVKLCE